MRLIECLVYGESWFWILLTLSLQKNLKNLVYKMLNFFKHQVSITREPQMQSLSTWVSLKVIEYSYHFRDIAFRR